MKNLLVDISRAVRSLRSHPVTSLVIAATVAIGIAAERNLGGAGSSPVARLTSRDENAVSPERERLRSRRSLYDVDTADVWDSYFQTLRIPILRGRAFLPSDRDGAPLAAVVNETLARRLWPQGDAVGRSFFSEGKSYRVVGVAQDGKYRTPGEAQRSFLYVASVHVSCSWNA